MTKVELTCKNCKNCFVVPYKQRKRKFCCRACVNLFQTGEGNPAYGKTYKTKKNNPEWAAKVSQTHLNRCHISGEKNPMKKPEVASKMGSSRSEKFRTDENFRKKVSELTRKAWKDGKYENVHIGKCKWYTFTKQDGATCKLQGTWELAYAKWLESQGINFIAHRGRISYIDENGIERSYYPDFYLPSSKEYVDIKNKYHFSLNEKKWERIQESNPDLKIILIFEEELKEKGIL